MNKLAHLTIAEAHERLAAREISSRDLTEGVLGEIQKNDSDIGAYLSVFSEMALARAQEIDKGIADGRPFGALRGIPLAVKDNILLRGERATAASRILENYVASYSATVMEKLEKSGCIVLGKTNLDEFAMGSSTEHSAFRVTRNPHDRERVPGGSSGGSAAAVAAREALAALGSDTGGSIRQPAAFCGVVGLKPTYGAVSRYGLIAMASSLDQIGPIAKTVEDAALLFAEIRGRDGRDATSMEYRGREPEKRSDLRGIRIGVPKEYFVDGMEKEVQEGLAGVRRRLAELGAEFIDISLSHTEYALATYYVVMEAEASANLARYDGIRYGASERERNASLSSIFIQTRSRNFGEEAKRRILLGTYVLSAGYCDAYYLKAQKVRRLIKQDFDAAWEKADVLLTPTTPTRAFRIGEKTADPLQMYLSDIFTVPVNLAGLPALSVPVRGDADALPVGFQLIGKPFDEAALFEVGMAYEQSCAS